MASGKGKPSTRLAEWLLVALIVFTLALEFVLHKIEHWINHRHAHLQAVLKVLYRELMILGLVSFLFVIYETIEKPSKTIILSFEFAHFFIFLLAVVYTIVVCVAIFASLRLSARWKRMEQVDLVKYLHLKEQYTGMRIRVHKHKGPFWRWFWWWFPNVFKLWHYCRLHEMMAFHDIRFQFIFYRNLPEHFRFSSFLRKIKSVTFVQLVESHWSLYIIFLVAVLLDLIRRYAGGSSGDKEDTKEIDVAESVFIICASVLLAVFGQILSIKIRKIYWELTKNPRIYYEGVEAAAVAEEIAAADARLSEQRMRRRASKSVDGSAVDTTTDGETTDASKAPETAEMMDPMHLQITPTNLGTPNPDLASPIGRVASVESGMATEIMPQNFRPSDAGSSQPSSSRPYHYGSNAEDDLREIAARHSLDYKSRPRDTRSASNSVEYSRANRSPPANEVHVPIDSNEVAARHSLEQGRNKLLHGKPIGGGKTTRDAMVAKAAVEAARKRSMEGLQGRGSVDSPMPDGRRLTDSRQFSDTLKKIGSPRILSRISSRGTFTDTEARTSSDFGRASHDGRVPTSRRSIELAAAMPREELAKRNQQLEKLSPDRDLEAGIVEPASVDGQTTTKVPGLRVGAGLSDQTSSTTKTNAVYFDDNVKDPADDSMARQKSMRKVNTTIIKHLEQQEKAKSMEPDYYPDWVKKLIPRLGRVASPVEKLFWFGSHHFFMWCLEFCLFFSTVVFSASTAALSLLAVRKDRIDGIHIAAMVTSTLGLLFVLSRIAGIMKRYIFILHNASLVPEALAIETIQVVSKKSIRFEYADWSGSETEMEEQSAVERRKTLGKFFRSEAESGKMPGIDAVDATTRRVSADREVNRTTRKRISRRRRSARLRTRGQNIPSVPDRDTQVSA